MTANALTGLHFGDRCNLCGLFKNLVCIVEATRVYRALTDIYRLSLQSHRFMTSGIPARPRDT